MSVVVSTAYSVKTVAADRSNYWRYYGLKRDPFVPGTRENEFYLSPRWEQSFDLIHYLCQEANVLLTVSGGKGSGKTTFLRQFIDHFGESLRVCQLAASANLDVASLIAALTREFALPAVSAEETLEEQLDAQLSQLQYSQQLCLLTIDSAHRLSDETLQALLYLIAQQSEDQMRLHILLVGESNLKDRLASLAEQNGEKEICHHITLEPFDLAETKNYLTQRMSAAGLPAALPLSTRDIVRIHNQAQGIPSRINALARQVLFDAISQRRLNFVFNFLSARKSLLLGGSVLLLILLLCAIFLGRGSNRPPLAFITTAKASDATIGQATAGNIPVIPTPVNAEIVSDNLTKPVLVNSDQAIVVNQSSIAVENKVQTVNAPVEASPTVLASNDQQQVMDKPVQQPIHIEKMKLQAPRVTGKSAVIPTAGNYTIQLLGAGNEAKIKAFVNEYKLQNKVEITQGEHQGRHWYTVLYGRYTTEADAIQAVKQLPTDLQSLHPWVKKSKA